MNQFGFDRGDDFGMTRCEDRSTTPESNYKLICYIQKKFYEKSLYKS